MTTGTTTATIMASKKEIKDMLVLLKWSEDAAKIVSEDEIDNEDLLTHITVRSQRYQVLFHHTQAGWRRTGPQGLDDS